MFRNKKTNTLLICTPEGISFSLRLAGPVTRFMAWGIDSACVSAAAGVTGGLAGFLGVINADLSSALYILAYFLISIGYGIATEWHWRGQTVGKRLLRLRVMDAQGLRLKPSQVVVRNIVRFVDSLPLFYFVGGVACLFSRYAQRLGDMAANTVVVRNPEIKEPDMEQIMAGKYNSLRENRLLCARLRQKVSPAEASLALQAVLRRDEMEPEARILLFNKMAGHFRSIVQFREETVFGISDEQYMRNVVDILYSTE